MPSPRCPFPLRSPRVSLKTVPPCLRALAGEGAGALGQQGPVGQLPHVAHHAAARAAHQAREPAFATPASWQALELSELCALAASLSAPRFCTEFLAIRQKAVKRECSSYSQPKCDMVYPPTRTVQSGQIQNKTSWLCWLVSAVSLTLTSPPRVSLVDACPDCRGAHPPTLPFPPRVCYPRPLAVQRASPPLPAHAAICRHRASGAGAGANGSGCSYAAACWCW